MPLYWKVIKSYFIREVTDNITELQIFYDDFQFDVYQFTSNNKMGTMSFILTPQYKIKTSVKKQIFGSKTFMNMHRKNVYFMKNFNNTQFTVFGLGNL